MDIRTGMPVTNSSNETIGKVVEADQNYIEIEASADGAHYWVPVALVSNIDDGGAMCLSASGDDLSSRWLTKDPDAFRDAMVDEASEESFPGSDPPSFNPQKS